MDYIIIAVEMDYIIIAVLEFTSNVKDDSPQAIDDMIWDKQTKLFTRELHVQLK